jgi:hypothetical protein
VSEKEVLRRILGTKTEEITEWRNSHNEGLSNLYFSLDIQIKEDKISRTHSIHGRDDKCMQNLKGRDYLGDVYIGGRIILK